MNRGRRPGGGTPSGTSGKSSTRAVLVKPRSLVAQPPGTSGIPASLRKIWCSLCLGKHYRTLGAISLPATVGNRRVAAPRQIAQAVAGQRVSGELDAGGGTTDGFPCNRPADFKDENQPSSLQGLNAGIRTAFGRPRRALAVSNCLPYEEGGAIAPPLQRVCPRRVCPRRV
jgi:hypothetical protein